MNWVQGDRVRIRAEEPKGAHFTRNGMVVWILQKTNEHKSLGFIHPQSDPDGTARQYEVINAQGERFRIWGTNLQAIEPAADKS
jgi:hypothetical protein